MINLTSIYQATNFITQITRITPLMPELLYLFKAQLTTINYINMKKTTSKLRLSGLKLCPMR
jgi:hypothetical protein